LKVITLAPAQKKASGKPDSLPLSDKTLNQFIAKSGIGITFSLI
jgi:hypothetical protein